MIIRDIEIRDGLIIVYNIQLYPHREREYFLISHYYRALMHHVH